MRMELLTRTIVPALAASEAIREVVVLWQDPISPLPSIPLARVVRAPNRSLNNRYNVSLLSLATCSAIVLDDDHLCEPRCVGWLWDNWNRAYPPPSLLGTVGRKLHNKTLNYRYIMPKKGQEPSEGKANFVLPPYMVSAALMNAYSAPQVLTARRYVDEQMAHCDDILLNEMAWSERLVVTRLKWGFGFFANRSQNISVTGISAIRKKDRIAGRTECSKWIMDHFSAKLGPRNGRPRIVDSQNVLCAKRTLCALRQAKRDLQGLDGRALQSLPSQPALSLERGPRFPRNLTVGVVSNEFFTQDIGRMGGFPNPTVNLTPTRTQPNPNPNPNPNTPNRFRMVNWPAG